MTVIAIGRARFLWRFFRPQKGLKRILEIIFLFNNLKSLYHGITICRSVENQDGRTH